MRENQVRRLPVLDADGRMVGIVSEKDLLYASPSPATSLSIYEMHYLLSQLKVTELMTKDVITVTPDTPLEEAARIMADNKIGGLPVRTGRQAGGHHHRDRHLQGLPGTVRRTRSWTSPDAEIPERKGEMARITTAIAELGGNILALGTFLGDDPSRG